MNDIQASHRPVYGGYIGIIRRVHKADVRARMWQARRSADLRHLVGGRARRPPRAAAPCPRGDLLRWGDKVALGARAEAEKLFSDNDLLRSGKRIPVLRK